MCFDSLLADRQGIELFRKYLENVQDKQGTKLIGMWLIYEGKFIKIIFDIETDTRSVIRPITWTIPRTDTRNDTFYKLVKGMRTTGKYNDSNELEFIKNIYKIGRRLIREYFGDGLSSTTEESSIGGMRSIYNFFRIFSAKKSQLWQVV